MITRGLQEPAGTTRVGAIVPAGRHACTHSTTVIAAHMGSLLTLHHR